VKDHHALVTTRTDPVRVLIVEDVADLRDFYAILLREEGYECACATDGSDALRWLSWDPDVILLDLMMPVMDGYEFYARMRDLPGEHPPVIVVSAITPSRSALPGIHATLPKPFDFSQLLHRVAAAATHGAASAT
jgi:CheY-like chemotaxis protein